MNPFSTDSQFDPRLYETLSRIGKKSNKTKLRGLSELKDMMDTIDVETNAGAIADAVTETMGSSDTQLRNSSADVLYELLSRTEERGCLGRILSIWLYRFIEDPTYDVSRRIFTEFVHLEEFEDEFARTVDFSEDPVLGLKCVLLLIKKGHRDYSGMFFSNVKHMRLSSAAELRDVYEICKEVGTSEEVYSRVTAVRTPGLMDAKWRILTEIFGRVPGCISEDGRYLSASVLEMAMKGVEWSDDIKVRNVESLRVVFPKVRDKNEYLQEYLASRRIDDMCIFEFCSDFGFLDRNVRFDVVNRLVENVLRKHFKNVDEASEGSSRLSVREGCEEIGGGGETNVFEHTCSSTTAAEEAKIFRILLLSLNNLDKRRRIVRGSMLRARLNPADFSVEEMESVFPYSVDVFPKEYMLGRSFGCDLLPLVLKYPSEVSRETVESTINKDNIHLFVPVCNDLELLRSLIFVYDADTVLGIYLSCTIPSALELDFYYVLGNRICKPTVVDYNRLVRTYLDERFIEELVVDGVVDRSLLCDAVLLCISSLCLSVNTGYTSTFYDTDECFYRDIKVRERDPTVVRLMKIYSRIYSGAEEAFVLLVLDAMCGDEDNTLEQVLKSRGTEGREGLLRMVHEKEEVVERMRRIDLKGNQHFVEKVLFDLGHPSRRCGNKSLEELLMGGGQRAIDYILRNGDVAAQFIPFIDFSYLSNKALCKAVDILSSAFGNETFVDFTGLSSMQGPGGETGTSSKLFFVEDDDFLRSLVNSDFRSLRGLDLKDVVRMVEGDRVLAKEEFWKERHEIYSVLLKKIYRSVADSLFNMYSISRLDLWCVDDEVYELLKGSLVGAKGLFWDMLLNSLLLIRNMNIVSFFERMVERKEEWREFLGCASTEQKSLFAFIFPNIFCRVPRMEIFMDPLIGNEAARHVMGVETRVQKLTNGFNIKVEYKVSDTVFTAVVSIPLEYPYKKPTFVSELGKKSLLNLKINEMIQRSSKFMELVGLWKMNIDEKVSGHSECPICYLILDIHDSSFPSSRCETCKNKFHVRCVNKWVASDRRGSCPICRRPMRQE